MNEMIIKNPITTAIKESIDISTSRVYFAVPFISSFATSIFNESNTKKIFDKKIITRFDDSFINSFDLPTLKLLLDYGFEIKFDNNIHLKLYIADNEAYITSSNLTKGGFVDNVELTVKVDSSNIKNCDSIFNEIWVQCNDHITYDLIKTNLGKYEILKKRDWFAKKGNKKVTTNQLDIGELEIQDIINEIFNWKKDYTKTLSLEFEANKLREQTKLKLRQSNFKPEIFYVPKGHAMRKNTIFYDFEYGYESKLAGTGLRELQFKTVFEDSKFEKVINYMYPEMLGMKPWNFEDKSVLLEFCNGIFDFDIPQYSEAIPIRLASYFYPDLFLPIFNLEHLEKICNTLGLDTDAKTKGDKLFAFNSFIAEKMKSLPFDNYIKMDISYHTLYTIELYNRFNKGEDYNVILSSYKENWKKNTIEEGKNILIKLNKVK